MFVRHVPAITHSIFFRIARRGLRRGDGGAFIEAATEGTLGALSPPNAVGDVITAVLWVLNTLSQTQKLYRGEGERGEGRGGRILSQNVPKGLHVHVLE